MSDVLRAADALADAAEALRDGTSSNRRANLTVALDAYRAARDTARTDGPTVGWVMRTSDADLMLHAQVVWQQLNKRGLTEPRTAEAQEWVDTHLNVVEALETAQAELADREDLMEMAQQEMDRLRGMNKRLRAELAETRAAGDALAHQAKKLLISLPGVPNIASPRNLLAAWVDQWRSICGDAPDDTSSEQE